jgi:glycosyltransferase involved in cell wall biosynthesis
VISVLIPTLNEEQDLPGCLASVAWSNDIHVYDSYSSDATVAIAQRFGARVTRREGQQPGVAFGGDESAHRNWALQNIPFKYPWVLHIDADERVTPALHAGLRAAVCSGGNERAFSIQRRDFFLGTWLRHVQATPYYIRLIRPDATRYERLINPVTIVEGEVGRVSGSLDHHPFSKGIAHWVHKHNQYSTLEAREIHQRVSVDGADSPDDVRRIDRLLIRALFTKDFSARRRHQKQLFYLMPARPLLKFILLYIGKRGFLDGLAGWHYARLQALYEYLIVLKSRELQTAAALEGHAGQEVQGNESAR